MSEPFRFLVAESEPPAAREERRRSVGRSSGETFIAVLGEIAPAAHCTRITPADRDSDAPDAAAIAGYDAVFLSGSPLHLYEDTPETRREVDFMRAVFASGTPSFGSCAGLQVATVAAGGTVRSMRERREAGFARRLTPTAAGRDHPLLAGRPAAFDAPAVHSDEVERLPPGATLLASNRTTAVQAAEIRFDRGVFWGVQYHPEISLEEVAAALRRQMDDLVEHGLARDAADVEQTAALVDALGREPDRVDLAWRLGLDDQVTVPALRRTELRNFIDHLVVPTRAQRRNEDRRPGPGVADTAAARFHQPALDMTT
jgi:GMP synthase (glutamine-hydrolysing)